MFEETKRLFFYLFLCVYKSNACLQDTPLVGTETVANCHIKARVNCVTIHCSVVLYNFSLSPRSTYLHLRLPVCLLQDTLVMKSDGKVAARIHVNSDPTSSQRVRSIQNLI